MNTSSCSILFRNRYVSTFQGVVQTVVFLVAAGTIMLSTARPTWAVVYSFTNVVDNTGPYGRIRSAAINDATDLVFHGEIADAFGIFTGPDPLTDTVSDSSGPFRVYGEPQIDGAGTPYFKAILDADIGVGIYTGPDPIADQIVDSSGPFSNFSEFAVNDAGKLVFAANLDSGVEGIYFGTNPASDTLANDAGLLSLLDFPAVNSTGLTVFSAKESGDQGIFTGPNPATDTLISTVGPYNFFGKPAINDTGTLAFRAGLDASGEGIFTGPNPATDAHVTSDGPYSGFTNPLINNAGTIVFGSGLDAGGYGIFTGADPSVDHVIRLGDPLYGSIVDFVNPQDINNLGQIALTYRLTNGLAGVVIAEPSDVNISRTAGSWSADFARFIDSNDPEAHHGMDTLVVHETATDDGPFDLEITVTNVDSDSIQIAIDKNLLNATGRAWEQVLFTLGTKVGDDFTESTLGDGLHFLISPEPKELTGALSTVNMDDISEPNNLVFDGRLDNDETASFWVSITAPDEIDGIFDDRVTFVLRQTTFAVPEPNSDMLIIVGLIVLLATFRTSRRFPKSLFA